MLVPAQLYKEELRNKIISTWYSLEYQYYWQSYNQEPNFDDNNLYGRQFAFVEDDNITLKIYKNKIVFEFKDLAFQSRLIDG